MEYLKLLLELAEDKSLLLIALGLGAIAIGTLKTSKIPSVEETMERIDREETAKLRLSIKKQDDRYEDWSKSSNPYWRDQGRWFSDNPKWEKWKMEYTFNLVTREDEPIPENIGENIRNGLHDI